MQILRTVTQEATQDQVKSLTQALQSSGIKITVRGNEEFAGTEQEELSVFVEAGVNAIEKYRQKRLSEHKQREYYKKLQDPVIYPKFNYAQLKERTKAQFPNYVVDDFNAKQVRLMLLYFSQDERLLNEGYSLNKGICLMGGVGVGKTTLMGMFTSNQVNSYVMRSCLGIAKDYSQKGAEVLDPFLEPIQSWKGSSIFGHEQLGVCFDDLGTENDKNYFGNATNVMADIILGRYEKQNMSRTMTHFTTNLTTDEIEERYGTRVKDRINEMFNIINFDGTAPSRRK